MKIKNKYTYGEVSKERFSTVSTYLQITARKALICSTESAHVLYTALCVFINALRSGCQMASIREVTGLTHTDVTSGNNGVVTAKTIRFFTN